MLCNGDLLNALDVAIALAGVFAAVGGYRRGILARLIMWAVCAAIVAGVAQNLPSLASWLGAVRSAPRPALVVGTLMGGVFVGRIVGGMAGAWASNRIPSRPLRFVDRVLGGGAGLLGVAVTVWVTAPVLSVIPGWPATAIAGSRIAGMLDEHAPDGLNARDAVARLFSDAKIPRLNGELEQCDAKPSPGTQNECPAEAQALVQREKAVGLVSPSR